MSTEAHHGVNGSFRAAAEKVYCQTEKIFLDEALLMRLSVYRRNSTPVSHASAQNISLQKMAQTKPAKAARGDAAAVLYAAGTW